jgi:DNA repair exonuclease SbcCD nuclease subunit
MARVILVGDIHIRDTSPSSRREGYREDIIKKLEYVADLEKKIKADAVVWAGDVFHFPDPRRTSHATVLRMLEVVEKFNNVYVVPGNHDILNDRLESISEKQPLGVLVHGGLKILSGWDPELPIFGVPWQQDWIINDNAPLRAFEAFREGASEGRDPANSLAITHAPIYPPEEQQSTIFELLPTHGENSVAEAMGGQGSLYYGHIHEDHGVFEDGGVQYCNVGALSRGSLHEYNLERQIQVAIWDTKHGFIPHIIPHKPASELFFVEEHTEQVSERKNLDAFLKDVGSSQITISSVESVQQYVQEHPDVDEKVKKLAVEILSEVG